MPAYRLYCLDGVGKISAVETFTAAEDEQAIAMARALKPGVTCELWDRNRLVAMIDRSADEP